jgi:hypothetical protein
MTKENVPRRLRRFYRSEESNNNDNYYNQDNYSNTSAKYDDPTFSKGRSIPTMDYEDIDEKNLNEIKKVEQQSLEEKLAMLEIEKFKKEKNRMPNKDEQEKLASSLYEQFKNNPSDPDSISEQDVRVHGRDRRRGRHNENATNDNLETNVEPIESPIVGGTTDIKSLFEDSNSSKNSKKDDDFDLNLDMDEDDDSTFSDDLEDMEDFSLDKKKKKKN